MVGREGSIKLSRRMESRVQWKLVFKYPGLTAPSVKHQVTGHKDRGKGPVVMRRIADRIVLLGMRGQES